MTESKFSDDDWSCQWHEADTGVDALGLTESKFSNGGWSWNDADSQVDTLDLTVGKLFDGGWSWNEANSLNAFGLTEGKFSDDGQAGIGMQLKVLMFLA